MRSVCRSLCIFTFVIFQKQGFEIQIINLSNTTKFILLDSPHQEVTTGGIQPVVNWTGSNVMIISPNYINWACSRTSKIWLAYHIQLCLRHYSSPMIKTLPENQTKCDASLQYLFKYIILYMGPFTDMLKRKRYFGRKDSVRKNIYFENYMQTVSQG